MLKVLASAAAALAVASSAALAQAPAPATSTAPAATPAPATSTAPAATTAPSPTNKVVKPAETTTAPAKPAATAAPATAPAATPAVVLDASGEARFKGLDKNNNGVLEVAELTAFSAVMGKIDTDRDGKLSRVEFASALKGGLIK